MRLTRSHLLPTSVAVGAVLISVLARRALMLVVLTISACGIVGCGSSTRHGDARLHTNPAIYGPKGHREWSLYLPAISLAEAGTHHFRVRGLPPRLRLEYGIELLVPEMRDQMDCYDESMWASAPWRDVHVDISVLSPAGAPLAEASFRPGDPFRRAGYESLPQVTEAVAGRSDYDLVVHVERASDRRSDRIDINGSGTSNDRKSLPRDLYDDVGG